MPDYEYYRKRLGDKIGEAMAADKVLEGPWWDLVIKDLNLMSYYFAHQFGVGQAYAMSNSKTKVNPQELVDKGLYKLPFEEWSHMRLLSLTLIISYWLGWQSPTHGPVGGLNVINQAYEEGLNVYLQSEEGKKWLHEDKGNKWLGSAQGKEWSESPPGKQWQEQQKQQQQSTTSTTKTS
jgi:hypothetical protein